MDHVDVHREAIHRTVIRELGETYGGGLALLQRKLPELLGGELDRAELVPELGEDSGHVGGARASARELEVAKDRRHLAIVRKPLALEPVGDDAYIDSEELRDLLPGTKRPVEEVGDGDRQRADRTGHGDFSLWNGSLWPCCGCSCRRMSCD